MIFRAKNFHKHYTNDPTEEIEDLEDIVDEIYNEKEEKGMENYYNEKY